LEFNKRFSPKWAATKKRIMTQSLRRRGIKAVVLR
jgi:hypothetical protein